MDGTALTFGVGMSTMMACLPPLDAAEAALKSVLPQVARWQIDGQILTLEDENGAPLMTMMAVYLQ